MSIELGLLEDGGAVIASTFLSTKTLKRCEFDTNIMRITLVGETKENTHEFDIPHRMLDQLKMCSEILVYTIENNKKATGHRVPLIKFQSH